MVFFFFFFFKLHILNFNYAFLSKVLIYILKDRFTT
jgi:hypothetical protein